MSSNAAAPAKKKLTKQRKIMLLKDNAELYSLMLPAIILIFIFCYIPMYGYLIAFQDYKAGSSFWGPDTEWVGLKHFERFYNSVFFSRLMGNTLWLSFLNLAWGFWVPIVFALLLNEVHVMGYKKFVQTASYLPYFISMVVMCGMLVSFISPSGIINKLIVALGGEAKSWRTIPSAFAEIYVLSNIWKSFAEKTTAAIWMSRRSKPPQLRSARCSNSSPPHPGTALPVIAQKRTRRLNRRRVLFLCYRS